MHEPVLLQGPRGSGKTTLLRRELPGYIYVALDDAGDRKRARNDPAAFLALLRGPAIVDDVQRAPELVQYLAQHPPSLPLIFASSVRLSLDVATFELYGPTRAERQGRPPLPLEMLGRFAPAHLAKSEIPSWPRMTWLLDQDVRGLVEVHDMDRFEEFLLLAAKRSGELLHQQALASEIGVAHRTIVRWLDVLSACSLTLRLPPLPLTFGRRVVQRPKLHWLEESTAFESKVVSEIYRNACHAGLRPRLWYWRDSNGLEVPLIIEADPESSLVPVAIAAAPNPADEVRLRRWMELAGASEGALIAESAGRPDRRPGRVVRYALSQL